VSQPVNGDPGILAFRGDELYAVLRLEITDGRIRDIHAVADPVKLAMVSRAR